MKGRILIHDLDEGMLGNTVRLYGFIDSIRKLGALIFCYLRDDTGKIQVFFDRTSAGDEQYALAESLKAEHIVSLSGILKNRPGEQALGTDKGAFEIEAKELKVLAAGQTPPFEISKTEEINEALRGKFRYLEIRNPAIKNKIKFHALVGRYIREYFYSKDYLEIETPYLIKSTPEGARDFIVPSRNFKGQFYALAQSPQLLKQLLMASGFEKYFQIARCFRDEDLRADRQPEFSQLDMERAFVEEDEIFSEIEGMFSYLAEKTGVAIETPFPRMTYASALEKYASDKPDLRNPLFIEDYTGIFADLDMDMIRNELKTGSRVRGIKVPHAVSRSQAKKFEEKIKAHGGKGLIYASRSLGETSFTFSKYAPQGFIEKFNLSDDESIFFQISGRDASMLNYLRTLLSEEFALNADGLKFLWVTDFPLFEINAEGVIGSSHHPFTAPADPSDIFGNSKPLTAIVSKAYDIVLNGTELGSGSIRINDVKVQRRIFEHLGISEKEQKERFGFFLQAMEYGFPPHGGAALGIARIAAMLEGSPSIKDYIAFPKTTSASCLMTDSPSPVDKSQLDELGLDIKG